MANYDANDENVVSISGAGLNGCLTALVLAKRGFNVRIFEGRDDWRSDDFEDDDALLLRLFNPNKRSINLSIVKRGIGALKRVGIYEEAKKTFIPMPHRAIHPTNSDKIVLQPYGTKDTDVLYSVSRQFMNEWLLNKASKSGKVQIFNSKVQRCDKDGTLTVYNTNTKLTTKYKSKFVIGSDGAHSTVRDSCVLLSRGEVTKKYLDVGYKEIVIPATHDNQYALNIDDALHVWPRGEGLFMISMPNPDKSWTCTMIIPFEGEWGTNNINTIDKANEFFSKFFPDVKAVTPNVAQQFLENKTSPLISIWLNPFHYKDKILIMGDAAHAVTPFFGQGANSCFEDCELLDELMDQYNNNISLVFENFSKLRVKSAHALTDLCIAHGKELGKDTDSSYWLFKRSLGRILHKLFPSIWIPFMTMVAFTRTPYDKALKRKHQMDKFLDYTLTTLGIIGISSIIYSIKKIFFFKKNVINK